MSNRKEIFLNTNLTFLRKSKRLTQEQLGAVIGVSKFLISNLEGNSITKPNYFVLEALADYFGVDVEALVREDVTKYDLAHLRIRSAIQNLPMLNESELSSFLAVAGGLLNTLEEKKYFNYHSRSLKPLSMK